MCFTKHLLVLGLLLALSVLGAGWFTSTRAAVGQDSPPREEPASRGAGKTVSDQDRIQGTWRILGILVDGQPAQKQNPAEEGDLVITGNQMSLIVLPDGKKVKEFRFRLDAARTPKAIDLTVPAEPAKDKVGHGIYELDGDRLKICFPQDDNTAKERPTAFKSEAGSRHVLMTLKRLAKK